MPTPTPFTDAGTETFAHAVSFVIDILEGGGKVVSDTGGLTRWGISKNAHPELDIATLTREAAEDVYRRHYWNKVKADLLPAPIGLCLFSCAVNMGARQAVLILQRVLGVRDDGILGPETLIAVQGYRPQLELIARFCELWGRSYFELARTRPVYQKYLHGWSLRVHRTEVAAGQFLGAPSWSLPPAVPPVTRTA